MTLLDLATFVCGKVNQSEPEDLLACKGFFQQRFKMLWADQLWKDSVTSYTQTIDPAAAYTPTSSYLPTKGILLVPPIIERILAVRTDTRHLNVQRPEFYYRVDFDAFSKQGTPTDFLPLPPCVWELDSPLPLWLDPGNAADTGVDLKVTADTLDADGVSVTRSRLAISAIAQSIATSDRLDVLQKLATKGAIAIRATGGITVTNNDANAWSFFSADAGGNRIGATLGLGSGTSGTLPAQGAKIYAQRIPFGAVVSANQPNLGGWNGTVTFDGANFAFNDSSLDIATLAAADTAAKIRQRVRLVQIPATAVGSSVFTVRVLGKRTAPTFSDDLDSPGLTGVENCLIAFVQADMLQRERHYAKAQGLQQEGTLLLDQLKMQEVVQMAHEQRIIPETGYGAEEQNRLYGFSF